jgi:hypothetical protein
MFCSTDGSVAMFRVICSCFSVNCSALRRTTARSRDIASSRCTSSGEVVPAVGAGAGGDVVVEIDDNLTSEEVQFLTISIASPRWDSHADDPPTPITAAMKQAARVRRVRLPIDGRSLAN